MFNYKMRARDRPSQIIAEIKNFYYFPPFLKFCSEKLLRFDDCFVFLHDSYTNLD